MMTRVHIPGATGRLSDMGEECQTCGCNHLTDDGDDEYVGCPHRCYSDVNIDTTLSAVTDYTPALRSLVARMLKMKWEESARASNVLDEAWQGFETWAETSEDGVLYRDAFDNLWRRKNLQAKRRKELAAAGVDEVF